MGGDTIARILVTRPLNLARETAHRLQAMGHTAMIAPLMQPEALAWNTPAPLPDALLLTSPQTAQMGGDTLDKLRLLPVYAVGERTARAARAAGLHVIHVGNGNAADLCADIEKKYPISGHRHILHLCGEDVTPLPPMNHVHIVRQIVYRARLIPDLPEPIEQAFQARCIDWVMLFSSRSAAHFTRLYDRTGCKRHDLAVVAISPRALQAAGTGWHRAHAATHPTTQAMLDIIGPHI